MWRAGGLDKAGFPWARVPRRELVAAGVPPSSDGSHSTAGVRSLVLRVRRRSGDVGRAGSGWFGAFVTGLVPHWTDRVNLRMFRVNGHDGRPAGRFEGGVMKQAHFDGRILVLGFGGVARCTLPLLLKHLDVPRDRITVLDMADISDAESNPENAGVRFVRARITRRNLTTELSKHVGAGDLLVDLAWNISCVELLEFCRERGVLYVNTSVELWDPYAGAESAPPTERTLYVRQMEIRRLIAAWGDNGGPTAVLDHGANPGLVSHFTKLALRDLAGALVEREGDVGRRAAVERALADNAWNRVAALTGVKVIHVSELDTQIARTARRAGEFLNTWSVEGFYEESIAPAEMGWGTHEGRCRSTAMSTPRARRIRSASPVTG